MIFTGSTKTGGDFNRTIGESDGPCTAVIGLGLNFYVPEHKARAITQDWVDVNSILAANASTIRNQCAAMLLNQLMPVIANFEQENFAHYVEEWREFDCMQGKVVDIYQGKQVFNGVIQE